MPKPKIRRAQAGPEDPRAVKVIAEYEREITALRAALAESQRSVDSWTTRWQRDHELKDQQLTTLMDTLSAYQAFVEKVAKR